MSFKKPKFWISTIVVAVIIAVGVFLLTGGQYEQGNKQVNRGDIITEDETEDSEIVFDESKVQKYWLETAVINDCLGRNGPDEDYESVCDLKYGDIILVNGKYNNWVICTKLGVEEEFWVEVENLIGVQQYNNYNLGVVTADEVTVGTVTLKKGNLIQVLKKDQEMSCVTIKVIDINAGKTGWISNSDYIIASKDVFYNQAYLKKGTIIFEEPLVNAQKSKDFNGEYELFVNIDKEQDGWVHISTYGPIDGWVQKENIFIPVSTSVDVGENAQVDKAVLKVDILLDEIIENVVFDSSNPFDYIKDSEAFNELVVMGKPALDVMMEMFAKSNEDGLKEYVMAVACAKIMGVYDDERGIGISSGREWFYKYGTFEKNSDFQIVDADYDLFKNSSAKPKLILPDHTNMKNMDDVISNYILTTNRKGYLVGEKALESHYVYRTEEKDDIINVYMLVNFQWFGFENGIFTPVSGGSQAIKMQLINQDNGEYEVLEYKRNMDGGMWAESIQEMFPKDIAEIVISGDEKTRDELWNMQVSKAHQYLQEVNREDAKILSRVEKERSDDKAARKAIYLVTSIKRDFPEWIGTREILVKSGGPHPGINIRCTLETQCEKAYDNQYDVEQYIVTLTKIWDIKINGVQPISYWKYRITGEKVELIEEQDNDSSIKIIK